MKEGMTRKERRQRAEQKKEAIRKEIFSFMYKCSENKTEEQSFVIVNKGIDYLIKRNPQEAHFVHSVCAEIKENPKAFCNRYLSNEANIHQKGGKDEKES